MDIKQLKYFRAIVEEGHISGAAKRLFMTQPSLSQQLRLLETDLGVRLLERGSRHVTLTEAGRLLWDRAGQILDLLQTTERDLKELHEGYQGTLSLGTIASSGVTLLPGLLRDFHRQFPHVRFQLWEGDTYRILDLLNNGLIEVGIVRSVFDSELYHSISLPPEPMLAAMSDQWAGAAPDDDVSLAELADSPLLLHHSYESMVLDFCHQAGFAPQTFCKGDDVRTLLVLASEGFGLAVVPASALGLVPSHRLRYKPIAGSLMMIKKSVAWLRQRNLSAAAKHFINTVLAEVK